MTSWWWPKRPARVPRAWIAGLLAGLGAVLFGTSAVLLKAGAVGWDLSLFRILNEVPPAVASVLTPLVHLFRPAAIVIVVVLIAGYVVAWNRSALPVAGGAVAAGAAWALANTAKVIANRPRPYEVVADAVLRQQPAHGTSFPSSHTAVTVAVVIALVPFLPRVLAGVAIAYAVLVGWSRVYLGVHYPLDVLAGAGIGLAVGGAVLLGLGVLLHRAESGRPAPGRNSRVTAHSGLGSQRKRRTATMAPITPQAARTARCRQSAPVCRASGPVSASLNGRIGSQPVTRLSS